MSEREEFEHIRKIAWQAVGAPDHETADKALVEIHEYAKAQAARAHGDAVPEGWKLVPVEPTEQMSRAGVRVLMRANSWATGVFQAMVSAAPTPPQAEDE